MLAAVAGSPRPATWWARVDLWWGDERFVPEPTTPSATPARPGRAARPRSTSTPRGCTRCARRTACTAGRRRAAAAYAGPAAGRGRRRVPVPSTCVLLGMGPEGHTASIFPASPAVARPAAASRVHDCPKPPPTRMTLGLGALSQRHGRSGSWSQAPTRRSAVRPALAGSPPTRRWPAAGPRGREHDPLAARRTPPPACSEPDRPLAAQPPRLAAEPRRAPLAGSPRRRPRCGARARRRGGSCTARSSAAPGAPPCRGRPGSRSAGSPRSPGAAPPRRTTVASRGCWRTRTTMRRRGAASPRSASPIGPAPTGCLGSHCRLPRELLLMGTLATGRTADLRRAARSGRSPGSLGWLLEQQARAR